MTTEQALRERVEILERGIYETLDIAGRPYTGMAGESKAEIRKRGQRMCDRLVAALNEGCP